MTHRYQFSRLRICLEQRDTCHQNNEQSEFGTAEHYGILKGNLKWRLIVPRLPCSTRAIFAIYVTQFLIQLCAGRDRLVRVNSDSLLVLKREDLKASFADIQVF